MRFVQITAAIVRNFVNVEVRVYAFVAGVLAIASERLLDTRMHRWTPTTRGDHWQSADMQSMYASYAYASAGGRSALGMKRLAVLRPALVLAPCTGRSCS